MGILTTNRHEFSRMGRDAGMGEDGGGGVGGLFAEGIFGEIGD